MSSPTKRTRFDASALSPSDTPKTPMATARLSLNTSVESLQPEVATILAKLGLEYLAAMHKLYSKLSQLDKFEDEEFIPRSARVDFTLKCSKLVEQDEEYINLSSETDEIVTAFQQAMKNQIFESTKLEIKYQKQSVADILARHLQMTVKTCLTCEKTTRSVDPDKFVNTLLFLHEKEILKHLDITSKEFRDGYKRIHNLSIIPPPFVTSLSDLTTDSNQTEDGTQVTTTTRILPPNWLLCQLPKIWRIIDQVFVTPWDLYQDIVKRNETSLALKKLKEEFFNPKTTDDTAMLIDTEAPVDPQVLNDLITSKISSATKKMSTEINQLQAKIKKLNTQRDHSGAKKKKLGNRNGRADGKSNDTNAAKTKQTKPHRQRERSPKSLKQKTTDSKKATAKSKRTSGTS